MRILKCCMLPVMTSCRVAETTSEDQINESEFSTLYNGACLAEGDMNEQLSHSICGIGRRSLGLLLGRLPLLLALLVHIAQDVRRAVALHTQGQLPAQLL